MDEHFTCVLDTEVRWNSLCSLLDDNHQWKQFAIRTIAELENKEFTSLDDPTTTFQNIQNPSSELFRRMRNDQTVTTSKLIQILNTMMQSGAVALIESWIHDDTIPYLHSLLKKQNLLPGEDYYHEVLRWFWKYCYIEAEPYLLKSADLNYPPAFLRLASVQEYSHNTERKQKYTVLSKSHKDWFMEQAITGDPIAQYHMGIYLEKIENNVEAAFEWYEKAAEQGNPIAQNNLGWCYESGKGAPQDWNKAYCWYQKAAENQHAIGQCNFGWCFEHGKPVDKDPQKAAYWYEKAAKQGIPRGMCNLAHCYEVGFGVEKDLNKAAELYKKAAEKGYARGQFCFGWCFQNGTGVQQDYVKALEWYRKAADQKFSKVYGQIGYFYLHGYGTDANLEEAFKWFQKGADVDNADCQYQVGCSYEAGEGVEKDLKKAFYWYQKAANNGHADAQVVMGYFCETGEMQFCPQDRIRSMYWYHKAAEQGSIHACRNLGIGYYLVQQDYKKAVHWFMKAAAENVDAQLMVGLCYHFGNGVEQDHKQALFYWKKAADNGDGSHKAFYQAMAELYQPDKSSKQE